MKESKGISKSEGIFNIINVILSGFLLYYNSFALFNIGKTNVLGIISLIIIFILNIITFTKIKIFKDLFNRNFYLNVISLFMIFLFGISKSISSAIEYQINSNLALYLSYGLFTSEVIATIISLFEMFADHQLEYQNSNENKHDELKDVMNDLKKSDENKSDSNDDSKKIIKKSRLEIHHKKHLKNNDNDSNESNESVDKTTDDEIKSEEHQQDDSDDSSEITKVVEPDDNSNESEDENE